MNNLTKRRQELGTAIGCVSDNHHMHRGANERDWSNDNSNRINLFPSEGMLHSLENELAPASAKVRQHKPTSQQNQGIHLPNLNNNRFENARK